MMLSEINKYTSRNSQYSNHLESTPSPIYTYQLQINMNATDYWPIAREYSVWNAAVAALQFWTADLQAHILSSAIEQVYNAFFSSTSMHLLCQQSDEILFECCI